MKCPKCGNEMISLGVIPLQDDYADKEELFCDVMERFKCELCDETFETLKRLNKE